MKFMGWSWYDYMTTPISVIEAVYRAMQAGRPRR